MDKEARLLALIGGGLGLGGAAVLAPFRFVGGDGAIFGEEMFGNAVFALVYLSPYLITLVVARTRDPVPRAGLLLALCLLSVVASASAFSLVTVVLFPASIAIFLAAAWSLRLVGWRGVWVMPYFAVGLVGVAAVVLSFLALFVLDPDEPRCFFGVNYSSCVSDIITSSEAAKAALLLLSAGAVFIFAAKIGSLSSLRTGQKVRIQDS